MKTFDIMEIAILESGNYFDTPDTVRVFLTEEKAIENIPNGFEKEDSLLGLYYENETSEKWLTIKIYEVEK